jgi:phosphoglycerate dehydrogenase-like enzyme
MTKPVVLVQLESDSADAAHFAKALSELASAHGRIQLRFVAPNAAGELAALAGEVEIWTGANFSEAFLAAAHKLKWVSFFSAGVDGKVNQSLLGRELRITTASGVHGPNVAEHILGFMLILTHGFVDHWRDQVKHEWHSWSGSRAQGGELAGQSLLVVGLGQIGAALAQRAKALGMTVTAIKRDLTQTPEGLSAGTIERLVAPEELDRVLPDADHVALCAPLTGETLHLFDRARIARMKRGSFLYNIARGGLIDSAALVEAIQSGQIGGAGLDVFEKEPLPGDSPLWDLPNVIVTPHKAGVTPHYYERAAALFAANLRRYLAGEPLEHEYSATRGY